MSSMQCKAACSFHPRGRWKRAECLVLQAPRRSPDARVQAARPCPRVLVEGTGRDPQLRGESAEPPPLAARFRRHMGSLVRRGRCAQRRRLHRRRRGGRLLALHERLSTKTSAMEAKLNDASFENETSEMSAQGNTSDQFAKIHIRKQTAHIRPSEGWSGSL